MTRDYRLFQAVLGRIGKQGDMHIRISTLTLSRIERACGIYWERNEETHREIDARALEALVLLAAERIAA